MNKRIEKIRELFDANQIDGILVTSATNRRYISGFTGSTGVVIISKKQAAFITDFRYIDQAKQQCTGYEIVDNQRKMNQTIKEKAEEFGIKNLGFEKEFVSYSLFESFSNLLTEVKLVPISGMIEELRIIKDEEELSLVKRAIEIADHTFSHILSYIKPGVREDEIALEMEYHMQKLGASGNSFDTIVASGVRSALPHGRASEKVIQAGEFVTLDFGAIYQGYISDITRTVAVGEVSDQLREIYNIVLEAQLAGVQNISAGITGREADAFCRDIITKAGYGEAFGHSTGHGIGLDVHEAPAAASVSEVVLKPGMLLTVEPGIYLSGIGGVRIEDDILITENGNEILTKSTKELIILG